MNPDQWARVKEVFHAALEHAAEDRRSFVASLRVDSTVRAEVERLLAAHVAAEDFIEPSPPPADRPSLTGHTVGRYQIGGRIGSGGMGEVYVARDLELGRHVAVKIALAEDADLRLRREAQHASHLNHPNICTIHEVGTSRGRTYIVMEYVEGQRLSDLIGKESPPEAVVRYGIQLADALAHAHQQGVVHRDLKSANVVVTSDGRPKVLDFGLARSLSAHRLKDLSESKGVTADGFIAGTLAYMAPELLRGNQADPRSDIWALGVVLYELASGTRPFAGETGFELSAAILHEPPAPLPQAVPTSLRQIVRRCLAKDPRDRYAQADEVRAALEAVQAEIADGARSASLAATRWLRRPMARVAAVGVLVALITAGSLIWRSSRSATAVVGLGAGGRPAIAVMAFDNLAGADETAWLSKGIPSMLLTGLAQTRGLDIISAQRLQEVVRELGGSSLETLPRDKIVEAAQRAGAGAIVVGGISKVGSEIRIDAQLEDLANGKVLAAESVRGTDPFVLVDQLAARIRDGIGIRDTADIRKIADVSTASLEAFQLYSQGVDAYINTRWEDAQKLFERAVAMDPTFADAYLHLAHTNYFRGYIGLQREYLAKATEHADRLSARQRLILEAESARASGDSTLATRIVDELIDKFPDAEEAYAIASQLYAPVSGIAHNPQKLLTTAAAGAAALPNSILVHNVYGYALLGAGRYPQALSELEKIAGMAPREPNPYDSLGEAYLMMGAADKAVESYSRALAIDPTFSGSHMGRAWGLATLARYDDAIAEAPPQVRGFLLSRVGRYREAEEVIQASRREAENSQNDELQGSLFLISSLLAIERKQFDLAVRDGASAERLFMRLPEAKRRANLVALHLMNGIAQVGAGRLDRARLHFEVQGRLFNAAVEPENWWHKALEGEIALAVGDLAHASKAFSAGQPAGRMWFDSLGMGLTILANDLVSRDGLARVAKAEGDLSRAIRIYRQLLTHGPDQKWVAVFEPRYVLEVGRLLDRSGDREAALTEYERFLELWKRADLDLPELAEARRAAARLRTASRASQ